MKDFDKRPTFYTVREAAEIMRCNASTLYRAIREGAFPAVRIRNRYVVPVKAIDALVEQATQSGGCVDVAELARQHRTAEELSRVLVQRPD
jgi:excisionase family DNA binding protein